MPTNLRFAEDEDVLRLWPAADRLFPRTKAGKKVADWDPQHALAMTDLERWIRASKSTGEPAELGRVGLRGRERLRDCAAYLCLHHLCAQNDVQEDNDLLMRKGRYFYERAQEIWEAESVHLDYDLDRSGDVDAEEKNQPFPHRVIRG